MNNISVIILAGGFGTRLKSVLDGKPKALADINGKPFIHLLVNNLKKQGFNNFIFSLHYKANQIIDFLEQDIFKEFNFEFLIEDNPLGTGGAISFVVNNTFVSDEFFVVNADTWLENGYKKLNLVHGNAILINKVDNSSRYGSVVVNQNDLITEFVEKNNVYLIYVSTDYIFDGKNGMRHEEDDAIPTTIYGKTKLESDNNSWTALIKISRDIF